MELTEQALMEFQELWMQDHPSQTLEQAKPETAGRFLRAFKLAYGTIPDKKAGVRGWIRKDLT